MPPRPPQEERAVGMEIYDTNGDGIGGHIKTRPEDFIVEEEPQLPAPGDGKQGIARVTAARWETNDLVETIASRLGIPAEYVGFAGMKDKQAVTTQYMSFPVSMRRVRALDLPRITVEVLYRARKPIYRGQLAGNHFHVTIRKVTGTRAQTEAIRRQIIETGGFPNFFGVQRFGILRPVTHLAGRYIVAGDLERAVMTYVACPMPGEDTECWRVRQWLEGTRDFAGALERYPDGLSYERRMIGYLAEYPGDWKGALQQLPESLLRLFVHAYQSWLFNRMLSERLRRGMHLNEAVPGDLVLSLDQGEMQQETGIPVTERNLDKINRQIAKYRCLPSAVLIGSEASLATGAMGAVEHTVLEQEGIDAEDFIIHEMPSLSSHGLRRAVLAPLTTIIMKMEGTSLRLSFSLPKGSYATCLLREFMKAPIQNY